MNSVQYVFKKTIFEKKFKIFFVLCQILAMTSCHFSTPTRSNAIIIAVEALGVNTINCLRDRKSNNHSGFDELCDNSVRFTHAFTPSIMAVPALSSILTGLNPFEHRVHHNGKQGLSAKFELLSEVALKKGYRTGFFSGGAPVLRKSQLHQGFEVFEDNLLSGKIFQSFKKTSSLFFTWLDESKQDSIFTVFYVPDLLFEDVETTNSLGESRPQTAESQIEEFDEALNQFFGALKKRNLWNNTYIVLVGLNAQTSDQRFPLEHNLDVLSSRAQVAMLVKPAGKARDQGLQWSVDRNISTMDIFPTINEIFNNFEQSDEQNKFRSQSFGKLLQGPSASSPSRRWIYTESGWGEWQNIGSLRVSVREDNLVYLHDQRSALFNTLTDHFETNSIPSSGSSNFRTKAREALLKMQIEPFRFFQKKYSQPIISREKLSACVELFSKSDVSFKDKRECDDHLTLELYDWFIGFKTHANDFSTEEAKHKFLRSYSAFLSDKKIAEYNERIGRIWDVATRFYNEGSVLDEVLKLEVTKNLQNVIIPIQKGISDSSPTKH